MHLNDGCADAKTLCNVVNAKPSQFCATNVPCVEETRALNLAQSLKSCSSCKLAQCKTGNEREREREAGAEKDSRLKADDVTTDVTHETERFDRFGRELVLAMLLVGRQRKRVHTLVVFNS